MGKKNIFLLSTLLLVLLLGLCSTSYANIQDDLTYEEFKNIIYNYLSNFGNNNLVRTEYIFTNYEDKMQTIYNNNPIWWSIGITDENNLSYGWVVISSFNTTAIPHAYDTGSKILCYNGNGSRTTAYNFNSISGSTFYYRENNDNEYKNITNFSSNYDIYNNYNFGSVVRSSGISPSNATDGPYSSAWVAPDYEFIPYTQYYYNICNASGNLIVEDGEVVKFYTLSKTAFSSFQLGQLINSKQTKSVNFVVFAYDNIQKGFDRLKGKFTYDRTNDLAYISNTYNTTYSGDFWISDIYISNDYIINDTILMVNFTTISGDMFPYYFYVLTDKTYHANGIIYPNITFSGDYYNNYIDNIDNSNRTDEIVDSLTGTTLDSGDEPTLSDLPTIEVSSGDDPSNDFFTWLLVEVQSVLNDNQEQVLEIPLYKNNKYYIRSDVFKLEIEPLKTFISCGWWFIVGVPFLTYIRRSIEKLKGGEIPASDEKSDLLGNVL